MWPLQANCDAVDKQAAVDHHHVDGGSAFFFSHSWCTLEPGEAGSSPVSAATHTHTHRLEPFVFCLLIHWLSQILSRWLGEEGEHCHFIGQTSVYSKRGTVSHGGTRKETEKVKTKFITVRWEWQWDVAKPCFLYSAVIAVGNSAKLVVSHSTTNSCIIAVLYCGLWHTRCCYEPFYPYCLRGPFHQARCCTSKMSGAAPR